MAGKKDWLEANPRRGMSHAAMARAFVKTFPVGTALTIDQFDAWVAEQGLLTAPSAEARNDRQSNERKAHLMRRHEQKMLLNKAGAHPRMNGGDSTPFFIVKSVDGPGKYLVRSPEDEAFRGRLAHKIQSITVNYRKWLDYQLQAPDYLTLPPEVKSSIEQVHLSIEDFGVRTNVDAGLLIKRLEGLKARLEQIGYRPVTPQIEDLTLDALLSADDIEETG